MDELTARAVLVPAPDVEGGLTTSIPRSQIEEALAQDETPIELILDVTRFSDGESIETRNVAITWEPNELKELLRQAEGDDVILTFDREALQEAVDAGGGAGRRHRVGSRDLLGAQPGRDGGARRGDRPRDHRRVLRRRRPTQGTPRPGLSHR